MNKFSKVAAAAALAVAAAGANAAFVIDDFSTSQALVRDGTTGDGGVGFTSVCGGGIIGGCRDIYVEKFGAAVDDDTPGFPGLGVSAFVNAGRLAYSQDTGQRGIGIVRWDGANNFAGITVDGLGGIDLTSGNVVGVRFQVLSADLNFPFTLQAWTDPTNTNTWVMSEVTVNASAGPGNYDVFFGGFAGADFSRVGALQLVLNNGLINDIDIQIDIIQNIPEPGTLALVGATLLGLGAARRRAAKKA